MGGQGRADGGEQGLPGKRERRKAGPARLHQVRQYPDTPAAQEQGVQGGAGQRVQHRGGGRVARSREWGRQGYAAGGLKRRSEMTRPNHAIEFSRIVYPCTLIVCTVFLFLF